MNTRARIALATVAIGAGLLGCADAPPAGADDLDPLADLFGNTGFNSWTIAADTDLAVLSPTLTADLSGSVENFEDLLDNGDYYFPPDAFSELTHILDPSAFTAGGLPDNAIGDLAVGTDYTLFASGLGTLDSDLFVLVAQLFG